MTRPRIEMPDDLLDPVEFLPQSPERRDILSENPLPQNLPCPLIPPPISRAERQLLLPPLIHGDYANYDLDAVQEFDDVNVSFGEADMEEARAINDVNRNWQELQRREVPGGCIGEEGGSFLLDSTASSAGEAAGGVSASAGFIDDEAEISQHCISDSSGASNRSTGSAHSDNSMHGFIIGLRERVRDPAERFRQLQAQRQARLPRQSTPEREVPYCPPIENETIDFPDLPESPPPTPPMSPRTLAQRSAAERRFQEVSEDPRNYYDANPISSDPRRRMPAPDWPANTTAQGLEDMSFEAPPSPTRGILITSPYLNPRLEEDIRTGARARIQALCAAPRGAADLPPRPNIEELAHLEPENEDDIEVVVPPDIQDRFRAAARIRAHFICYPAPQVAPNAPMIDQDCSLELNDDSIPPLPRGPHERYSFTAPRVPCDTRANVSLPRSHTFAPNAMHLREDLNDESMVDLVDRSLITESERGYINQTLPPRPQLYPCDRRLSAGFTPARAPQGRRLSMPRMDYEELPEPCPPEFLGTIGPLVFPNVDNIGNRSMIEDEVCDLDNVLDITEVEQGTHDTVQVQAPNKSPWKIQIKLMAPTGAAPGEPQPGPSGIRPPGRPGPSGIKPPGRIPQASSRQGSSPCAPGPSGIRPPGSSGLRAPSASGLRQPSTTAPCPPAPCPPVQSRAHAPPQSGLRPPSQAPSRAPSQTAMRAPSQSNICPPTQTGIRAPGAGTSRSPSQIRPQGSGGAIPRSTGAIPRSTGAIPRTTGAVSRTGSRACPPQTGGQSTGQATSQTRLQRPSQTRMRPPTRRC